MAIRVARFSSLLFTALAMSTAFAHLLELPNKMRLGELEYLTVQQIYRGWALLGIVVVLALLSTLVLTILTRSEITEFRYALAAFGCIALTLVVFFVFTYPVNVQTRNWTILPMDWRSLRNRWEYSHATNAILYLVGFLSLVLGTLDAREHLPRQSATPPLIGDSHSTAH